MPIHEPRTNVELRLAWRRKDPAIERDAELFWRKERLLPNDADVSTRLGELCMAGYDGDELIALSTARIRYIDFLGVKLAMVRMATAREKRMNSVGLFLLAADARETRRMVRGQSARGRDGHGDDHPNPRLGLAGSGARFRARRAPGFCRVDGKQRADARGLVRAWHDFRGSGPPRRSRRTHRPMTSIRRRD